MVLDPRAGIFHFVLIGDRRSLRGIGERFHDKIRRHSDVTWMVPGYFRETIEFVAAWPDGILKHKPGRIVDLWINLFEIHGSHVPIDDLRAKTQEARYLIDIRPAREDKLFGNVHLLRRRYFKELSDLPDAGNWRVLFQGYVAGVLVPFQMRFESRVSIYASGVCLE